MENDTKNFGDSSLRWNPPMFTPEETEQARRGREEMIRKAANGWDFSGGWQRALGVEPLN